MWTSQRERRACVGEAVAETGTVTLGGDPAGVTLGGERRWMTVYGPGGYSWRPNSGQRVLVLKAGGEQELPCLIGQQQEEQDLEPGQVRVAGSASSVLLGQRLELQGDILVNGQPLEQYVKMIISQALAGG